MERRHHHGLLARRLLFGACGLSVLACALVFGIPAIEQATGPVGVHIESGGEGTNDTVGSVVYFGVPLSVDGTGTVHLLAASVTGVPQGMKVLAVGAQSADTGLGSPRFIGFEDEASLRAKFPLFKLHPVSDAELVPNRPANWILVVVMKTTRPGAFKTGGLDVTAEQGGRTRTIHATFHLEVDSPDPAARIDMSHPVHLLDDCPGSEPPFPSSWQGVVDRAVRAGGGAAVIRLTGSEPVGIWNTTDGSRPTQAMVDAGLHPHIYEPQALVIERVIAGPLKPGSATGMILGGSSGLDTEGACSFTVDRHHDGPEFLAVFGPPVGFDAPAQQPALELRTLVGIQGSVALTPYGPVPLR